MFALVSDWLQIYSKLRLIYFLTKILLVSHVSDLKFVALCDAQVLALHKLLLMACSPVRVNNATALINVAQLRQWGKLAAW